MAAPISTKASFFSARLACQLRALRVAPPLTHRPPARCNVNFPPRRRVTHSPSSLSAAARVESTAELQGDGDEKAAGAAMDVEDKVKQIDVAEAEGVVSSGRKEPTPPGGPWEGTGGGGGIIHAAPPRPPSSSSSSSTSNEREEFEQL